MFNRRGQANAMPEKSMSGVATRPERPIASQKEDKLGRRDFVRRLMDALVSSKTKRATGIVVGITGEWGSGKSSILNLLSEQIKQGYPEALIVRFDPWLVSGRNDLISQFINELIRTIRGTSGNARLEKVADTLSAYGEQLAPIGAIWVPLFGPAVKALAGAWQHLKKSKESLAALRQKLADELSQASVPIVVLIDELDRIEDEEIRVVAQLVRSVADFPGISYVLAYDPKRVIQALGTGVPENQRAERGRSYLEKIVQLQIPLPVTFQDELIQMITAELNAMDPDIRLPREFQHIERYQKLCDVLAGGLIATPRDISRMTGTFHVLAGMLADEVDWIDLLGYSAALTKAPQTVDAIRQNPDEFTDDILSEAAVIRRMSEKKRSTEERLRDVIPAAEHTPERLRLVRFLFPVFGNLSSDSEERGDAIHHRRPLLSILRLGLVPGAYPRKALEELFDQSAEGIAQALRQTYANGSLTALIDRLDDLYCQLENPDHIKFWRGASLFARKPDCDWVVAYSPMHEVVRNMAEILERAVIRDKRFKDTAARIFQDLIEDHENVLTAHWLRRHIFFHGMFGKEHRPAKGEFLNASETERAARKQAEECRALHMANRLVPCRWDLMPIYTMLDTGIWNEDCRRVMDESIGEDRGLDALTLMLYGAHYTTDVSTVRQIVSYEPYINRVKERLRDQSLHETVRLALKKALDPI
jgi:hypothetical protein